MRFLGGDETTVTLTEEGKDKFIDACYDSGMTGPYEFQTGNSATFVNLSNMNSCDIKRIEQPFEADS
jgi:hypothetical protein